jgi:predicted DNA-binding transcriptional regulator AlpA
MPTNDKLLTPQEVSEFLNVSLPTLARWRTQSNGRSGPPYIKVGDQIRYRASALELWLLSRTEARGA